MKQFLIIFAFFFLFKPILPVLDYLIRYDYYANVLCENKDDVVLQCNGKCHLAKELAAASEEKNPFSDDKKNKTYEFELLFLEKETNYNFSIIIDSKSQKKNHYYTNFYQYLLTENTFHPPSVV